MKRKKFIAATLATAVLPLIGKSFGLLNQAEVGKGFSSFRWRQHFHADESF
jgi:hypothetical protein